MKKRILTVSMVMLVALSLTAVGCPPPPPPVDPAVVPPEPPVIHRWVVQSGLGAGVRGGYPPFLRFVERLYEMSGGRIVIEPHPVGAIVGAFEMFDAVREGILGGMYAFTTWWVGKEPGFAPGSGLIVGFPEYWQLDAWYWKRGGLELYRELYAKFDLFLVGPLAYGTESLHFTRPVDTVAEFKGLPFRAAPGLSADLFTALGADVIVMPGGEVYLAMAKGILEGGEFMPLSMMYDMGIHEVAPYFIFKGFHSPVMVMSFVVGMDEWEALGPELQAILEAAVKAWSTDQLLTSNVINYEAKKSMLAAGNVELFIAEEELAIIREKAMEIWEKWMERSPAAREIIQSKIDFKRDLGIIE
jgi:TRAP-type mannitol/chloroaromatic compound transport system substrate-binding protein